MLEAMKVGRRRIGLVVGAAAALVATLAGCKSNTSGTAPASSASAAVEKVPPNVDAELYRELTRISKVCKVDDKQAMVTCPEGDQRKLSGQFVGNQRSRVKALPTLTAALDMKNASLATVTTNLLYSAFRSPWGGEVKPGDVQAKDAQALRTAVLALPKQLLRQALPAAVHASMLANENDAVYAAIDKLGEPPLRAVGVRYLMSHGRLSALPKVQELSKDPNPAVALAAVESAQNMYGWTPDEQAKVCPWASELLADERPAVSSKAASLLGNCGGSFVDSLLDSREKALKAGKFTAGSLGGLRDLCSQGRRNRANAPTDEQCKRSRKILERVVEDKGVEEQVRNSAFTSLAYQWPDAETLKVAKRLEKVKDSPLAETARRSIQRLEQRAALAAAGSASPATKGAKPEPLPAPAPPVKPPAEADPE
jgi:hypothetical protein